MPRDSSGPGLSPATAHAFGGPAAFRAWLRAHHSTARELYVRCAKTHVGAGLTYRQALDEALCSGWIDGVRHALDGDSFSVRFTPRKPKSAWSTVNIRRYRELLAAGRVTLPGRKAFASGVKSEYSFESRVKSLAAPYLRRLRASGRAFAFFQAQPPWYRRTASFWVMSAKREETCERRLAQLIACCERGVSISPLLRITPRKPSAGAKRRGR